MKTSQIQKSFGHKQRGMSTLDLMIAGGVIIAGILLTLMLAPKLQDASSLSSFQRDASTIQSAVYRWKKARSNYTGVTLNTLCLQNILTKGGTICGEANNGVATNSYGGNWTVTANANPGLFNLAATLPNNPDSMLEVADAMAPITRGNCQSGDECDTILVAGTTITMTF